MNSKHPSCFVRGSRLRKSEFQAIIQNRWSPKKIVLRLKKEKPEKIILLSISVVWKETFVHNTYFNSLKTKGAVCA